MRLGELARTSLTRSVFVLVSKTQLMKNLALISAFLIATAAHAATKENRAAGQATFHTAGCAQCHGEDWSGTDQGPDLHGVGKDMTRERLTKRIHNGGGGMPPFADALDDGQISQLVDFLEAQKKPLKKAKQTAAAPAPPAKPKEDQDK